MSLIVMPTDAEVRKLGRASKALAKKADEDLVGHVLMLNTGVCRKFQCGGFQVGPLRPFATVTHESLQPALRRALAEGQLIDITGTDLTKGVKGKTGSTTAIQEEDTDKKAFIGTDSAGNVYVVTPKNKTEAKRMEREIKQTGTLAGARYQQAAEEERTGISAVSEEEVGPAFFPAALPPFPSTAAAPSLRSLRG